MQNVVVLRRETPKTADSCVAKHIIERPKLGRLLTVRFWPRSGEGRRPPMPSLSKVAAFGTSPFGGHADLGFKDWTGRLGLAGGNPWNGKARQPVPPSTRPRGRVPSRESRVRYARRKPRRGALSLLLRLPQQLIKSASCSKDRAAEVAVA